MFVLTTKSHALTKMMQMSCKFSSSLSHSHTFPSFSVSATAGTCKLTWDHVLHISESKHVSNNKTLLLIFKVTSTKFNFVTVVLTNNLNSFHLSSRVTLLDSFTIGPVGDCVSLHPLLKTAEERTSAVAYVIEHLGEKYIPHIRNELYPVKSSFDKPTFFSLERAAAPYFGIKAYAIHMSGYVELDGEKHLWIAKRSHSKSTYPGLLDHLVAGGLPYGIDCRENVVKECEEEAGIPRSISIKAKPVGAISYMDIDGYRYQRYVVFSYDLILPESFEPKNEDGEVDSFKLIPVKQVAEVIRKTQFFKPNCAIGIIDFLFRHGYISPENHGYLDFLRSLIKGDCS